MTTVTILALFVALLVALVANARARNRARGLNADEPGTVLTRRRALALSFVAAHGSEYDPNSFNQHFRGSKGDQRRRWRRKRGNHKRKFR